MPRWVILTKDEDDDAEEEINQYFDDVIEEDGVSDGNMTRRVIETDGWRNSDTGLLNQLYHEEKLSWWDRIKL